MLGNVVQGKLWKMKLFSCNGTSGNCSFPIRERRNILYTIQKERWQIFRRFLCKYGNSVNQTLMLLESSDDINGMPQVSMYIFV